MQKEKRLERLDSHAIFELRMLCLSNGERIKLPPSMTVMFEASVRVSGTLRLGKLEEYSGDWNAVNHEIERAVPRVLSILCCTSWSFHPLLVSFSLSSPPRVFPCRLGSQQDTTVIPTKACKFPLFHHALAHGQHV